MLTRQGGKFAVKTPEWIYQTLPKTFEACLLRSRAATLSPVGKYNLRRKLLKLNGAIIMMAATILLAAISWVSGTLGGNDEEITFIAANFADVSRSAMNLSGNTPHGEIAVSHLEFINDNLYDRFAFSCQERRTAAWIVEELLAMGYTWDDIEVQEYSLDDVMHFFEGSAIMVNMIYILGNTPFINLGTENTHLSQNVILTVPGQTDEKIVVGAHYDTWFFPGVSDNASGIALLLESAQRMLNIDNHYTIVYVFFGAEEVGLLGSCFYVDSLTREQHENIQFMINADVLLEGSDLFYFAAYDTNIQPDGRGTAESWLDYMDTIELGSNHITDTWDSIARDLATRGVDLTPWPDGIFATSDHLAFMPWGHTTMFLSGLDAVDGFMYMDVEVMDIFSEMARVVHSPRDDFHYINERWPDKIDENMRAFSIFLEELLLATYN